jgi:hypothetical protein
VPHHSGESPLARLHNLGFRCALGACDVEEEADSARPEIHSEVLA